MKPLAKFYVGIAIQLVSLTVSLVIFFLYSQITIAVLDEYGRKLTEFTIGKAGGLGLLLLAFSLGVLLFAIRQFFFTRPVYAVSEIFFGITGTYTALSLLYQPELLPLNYRKLLPGGTNYSIYVGLGSSLYVIVRGLDNWFKWFKEPIPNFGRVRNKVR